MASKEAFKSLIKALESFPKEKLTDLSFKEIQMDRFRPLAGLPVVSKENKPSIKDIVNKVNPYAIKDIEAKSNASQMDEDAIVQQIKALNTLKNNTYRDYYNVGDKMLRPQGNPVYYERLLADINGESKENIITGLRTVLLGK